MAIMNIEYHSEVLDFDTQMTVLYPDAARVSDEKLDDIPVLYLLHGMGGNHHSWLKRTPLDRLVRYTNLIVVLPDTHNGWYTNTKYGYDYFTALAEELPYYLSRFFPNMTTKREKTFIAGLSMGGYGAFKLALATNRFSYAASFSGALSLEGFDSETIELGNHAYWEGTFGDLQDLENNPNTLENIAKLSDKKIKLYAWCGEEDFLYDANNYFIKWLEDHDFDITYKHSPGKHEWYYWHQELERLLKWLPIDYVEEERLS